MAILAGWRHISGACRLYPLLLLVTASTTWLLGLLTSGFGFPQFHLVGRNKLAFSIEHEEGEQAYLWSHLRPTDAVLSVGGNIGGTCIFIDKLVADPSKSVCVEPNPITVEQLYLNKEKHGARFEVLHGILARPAGENVSFTDRGIMAHVSRPGEHVDFVVPTVDRDLSGFSVVVIDCEGCYCELLQQFPELMQARVILLEVDAAGPCKYDLGKVMAASGLALVDGSLRFFVMEPRHDVYSREPLSRWRRPLLSHLLQFCFTLRKHIGAWAGARPSLLETQVVLAMGLVSALCIACCAGLSCYSKRGKAGAQSVLPVIYGIIADGERADGEKSL